MPSEVLIKGRDAGILRRAARARAARRCAFMPHAIRPRRWRNAPAADILIIRTDEIFAELIDAMPKLRADPGADHRHRPHPGAAEPAASTSCSRPRAASTAPQMSELAFIFMLHFVRDFRDLFATQAAHRWNRVEQSLLDDRTAVIVGVGAIAEELAQRCKVFGMRVVGVSDGRSEAPDFDAILPRARLDEAAAQADFLIVLVPHTKETDRPDRRERVRRDEARRRADQHRARRRGRRGRADRGAARGKDPRRRPRRVPAPSRCRRRARSGTCRTCSSPRMSAA